jgi:hypothetical protein
LGNRGFFEAFQGQSAKPGYSNAISRSGWTNLAMCRGISHFSGWENAVAIGVSGERRIFPDTDTLG